MAASTIYGRFSMVDYSDSPRWRPALVQQNVNTWLTGTDAWNEALDVLIDESQNALELEPDAIIWPETAFVPAIEWHLKYRRDRNRVEMIKELYEFLEDQSIPFIIGNNDAILDGGERKESNAVLLFDENRIVNKYRKIHLVPFTESFPYGKQFPRLLSYIQDQGTPLYQNGEEFTLFDLGPWGGPVIGPIICFEDTFGYLSREFVSKGAEVLVNLTNDSWSNEPVAAIQHATISVFRAVENRRSLVRATTSGLTTAIDPNGRMLEKLPTFIAGTLIADVPIYTERETIYTRHGDWLEKVILGLAAAVAILSVVTLVLLSHRKRNQV